MRGARAGDVHLLGRSVEAGMHDQRRARTARVIDQMQIAIGVDEAEVARMPVPGRERLRRGLRVVPVTGHDHGAADPDFAQFPGGTLASLVVHHVDLCARKCTAHAVGLACTLPRHLDRVAARFPEVRIIMAHLGHPYEGECIVTIRKHENVFADVSALHYRPWQLYNSLMLVQEYGVWHKVLFGTDFPFTTVNASIEGLRKIVEIISESEPASGRFAGLGGK